jgi:hypothetical protein
LRHRVRRGFGFERWAVKTWAEPTFLGTDLLGLCVVLTIEGRPYAA